MSQITVHHGGSSPERVREAFLRAAEARLKRAVADVEGEIRRRAPFRTGHLRQSITSVTRREGSTIRAAVGTTTRYAPFLEFGTGLYGPRNRKIVPTRAQALRFPSGGGASVFAGGRRRQGFAGPGFRLSGQQRAGKAGGQAQFVFAKSVKGIHPTRFLSDAISISQGRVTRQLGQIAADAQRLLEGPR